jgi:hypothetical protein
MKLKNVKYTTLKSHPPNKYAKLQQQTINRNMNVNLELCVWYIQKSNLKNILALLAVLACLSTSIN